MEVSRILKMMRALRNWVTLRDYERAKDSSNDLISCRLPVSAPRNGAPTMDWEELSVLSKQGDAALQCLNKQRGAYEKRLGITG